MFALEVKNVSKKLGKKQVLSNVSFSIAPGEIVGLVGENGAGKSTLFRLITGLLRPDQGEIVILGEEFSDKNRRIFDQVGCLIESVSLYPHMTGEEHLKWMCSLCGCPYDAWVRSIAEAMKITSYLPDKVKTYSLGMKQRLGIAMALVNHPKLILLDEPTNGLDPMGIYEIREFLRSFCHEQQVSLLISSHILSEVEKLCDRVLLLQHGTMERILSKEELQQEDRLESIYVESHEEEIL